MGERRLTGRETDTDADRQRPYREDRDSKADRCSRTESIRPDTEADKGKDAELNKQIPLLMTSSLYLTISCIKAV